MAEYIERGEAIRVLSNPITMSMCVNIDECKDKRQQRETDLELIKSLTAADVAPVMHAKWEVWYHGENALQMFTYSCGRCGWHSRDKANYCSACGAKMDGET